MKFNQLIDRSNVLYKYNSLAFDINSKLKTKLEIKIRPDLTYLEYRFKKNDRNIAIIEINTTFENPGNYILTIKANDLIETIFLKHIVDDTTILKTILMMRSILSDKKDIIKREYYQHCNL
jgi:hypothetical protein